MKTFHFFEKTIISILFVIIFFSTSQAKSLDKYVKAEMFLNIFQESHLMKINTKINFLKRLDGLETSHLNYSIKYLYSLVNSENLKKAFITLGNLKNKNLIALKAI